ncbi:MAG: helix-turn-helix domain-containing protein [Lachnospiraceae bacterium]|nr:helix-turn-helix domain-containing protein [Lachnospiraceae bacterium]
MGIGNRIKEARNNLGYTQEELAKLLGVTKGAVANYEIETSHPKEPIMYKLIEVLQVDANYLFQDAVKLPLEKNDVTLSEYNIIKRYRALDPPGQSHVDAVLQWETERVQQLEQAAATPAATRIINYYYRLASAGTGQIIFDMPPTKRIEIPAIPEYEKADYAIGVNGNSMEPVYHDGDTLLVEMTDSVDIGEIGIFLVNGESFVKKRGETELISLNLGSKNVPLNEDARCLGKVIGKIEK